jgi:hypothetical protein
MGVIFTEKIYASRHGQLQILARWVLGKQAAADLGVATTGKAVTHAVAGDNARQPANPKAARPPRSQSELRPLALGPRPPAGPRGRRPGRANDFGISRCSVPWPWVPRAAGSTPPRRTFFFMLRAYALRRASCVRPSMLPRLSVPAALLGCSP